VLFKGIEICCPRCKGELAEELGAHPTFRCIACAQGYPVILGIPDLRVFPDPYIGIEADCAKGERIAARSAQCSFVELIDYYYQTTDVVPPQDARRYRRGLEAGVARATAALAAWERAAGGKGGGRLLELGCGTAPLLVAAAARYDTLVGVDVAFRWLVVARKRLAEAGVDVPLLCACAEALPFRDGMFDRVVAESVLEHVRDQPTALAESHRVLRPGGGLFLTTPNRFSLGPDPQAGVWAGGYWPERLLAAYVRRSGGIPPRRRLLSARSLPRLLREAGFAQPRIWPADVSDEQRRHFGRMTRFLIDGYRLGTRLPGVRQFLHWTGPLFHAVAFRPAAVARGAAMTSAPIPLAGRPALEENGIPS
jgi:SAM-dependent methyltransferase